MPSHLLSGSRPSTHRTESSSRACRCLRQGGRSAGHRDLALSLVIVLLAVLPGCDLGKDDPAAPARTNEESSGNFLSNLFGGNDSGGGLFNSEQRDRYSIFCTRFDRGIEGDPRTQSHQLAEMLARVPQLDRRAIQVRDDATGSSIYYGNYEMVPGPQGNRLIFPPEMQRDMDFIRGLTLNGQLPFALARPEQIEARDSTESEFHLSRIKGSYTLMIAYFYDTPTFSQRKQVAEQYATLLRKEGVPAFFFHEERRSFVFVGDFSDTDVIRGEKGVLPGPPVTDLIASRPEEFQYVTENGHLRKEILPDGSSIAPPAQLIFVPENLNASTTSGERLPAPGRPYESPAPSPRW